MLGECKTCVAFTPAHGAPIGTGFCRRHPPVPVVTMAQGKPTPANPSGVQSSITGQFPPVHESSGCCEHLAKLIGES